MERNRRLAEWSLLACTGLRKIKKKYNKVLGTPGQPIDAVPGIDEFAFLRSRERTEIEALAANPARGDSSANGSPQPMLECPVCLDKLTQPVAPPCGHAMCAGCFNELDRRREGVKTVVVNGQTLVLKPKGTSPPCPVCRLPATDPRKMYALAKAVAAAPDEIL